MKQIRKIKHLGRKLDKVMSMNIIAVHIAILRKKIDRAWAGGKKKDFPA